MNESRHRGSRIQRRRDREGVCTVQKTTDKHEKTFGGIQTVLVAEL